MLHIYKKEKKHNQIKLEEGRDQSTNDEEDVMSLPSHCC